MEVNLSERNSYVLKSVCEETSLNFDDIINYLLTQEINRAVDYHNLKQVKLYVKDKKIKF